MRRRKDFTSLLRNVERGHDGNTSMGIISSVAGNGSSVNGQNFSDGEVRDLVISLPYGISSSGLDGMRIQIIVNDNNNNVAVGVVDRNRPAVNPGCIKIYDKSGSYISLNGDGTIDINADTVRVNGQEI